MKKWAVASLALAMVCMSVLLGQSPGSPQFEVASIKLVANPDEHVITGTVNALPGGRLSAKEALVRYNNQRFCFASEHTRIVDSDH